MESYEHAGSRSQASLGSFLHSAVLQAVGGEAAVGLTAAFRSRGLGHFFSVLPAMGKRLQEQRDGGEQIAEPGQVERTVVCLSVVVQEACKTQAGRLTVW